MKIITILILLGLGQSAAVSARGANLSQVASKLGRQGAMNSTRLVAEVHAKAVEGFFESNLARDFNDGEAETIVIYDLGSSTFDISIVRISSTSDGNEVREVLTTEGASPLGGDDFDNRIVDLLVEGIAEDRGIDLSSDQAALARLRVAAVAAKKDLSDHESTAITVRELGEAALTVDIVLTRTRFELMITDLIDRTMVITKKALANKHLSVKDIDFVVMVGGSTLVPKVNEAVAALFGDEKVRREDKIVALGAAIQAEIISDGIENLDFITDQDDN